MKLHSTTALLKVAHRQGGAWVLRRTLLPDRPRPGATLYGLGRDPFQIESVLFDPESGHSVAVGHPDDRGLRPGGRAAGDIVADYRAQGWQLARGFDLPAPEESEDS